MDAEGNLLASGEEQRQRADHAEAEAKRAEAEATRATAEAERLREKLRQLGIEPD